VRVVSVLNSKTVFTSLQLEKKGLTRKFDQQNNSDSNFFGSTLQLTDSPYTVSPALQRVIQGNKLKLVVNAPDGLPLAGFMIQAKSNNVPIGSFLETDNGKTLTCGNGIKVTFTFPKS